MAATSTMLPLGTSAPPFSLTDTVTGSKVSIEAYAAKRGLLVMFICNHCPAVKHVRHGLATLGEDYAGADIGIVAISANDPTDHPDDGPEAMAAEAREVGYSFPYLFDETQEVAKAYTAICTPDFFLFGPDRTLVYRGRFDASRPSLPTPVTGDDLRAAIDALLAGDPVPDEQYPSLGCTIKWKPGNAPEYAA